MRANAHANAHANAGPTRRGPATRKERRLAARRLGKRGIARRAEALVKRILELSEGNPGRSPAAIASSVGLAEETVKRVLETREESCRA